ncbi:SEC-C metal-binding domain-containing protein [Cesiribacter andamanensis]|uniref:Preprotein translocase subunit SecA n=1 Tax=Cesiribacter andamanensis AMV16 TaxID=1279009 RepID=M7N1D8_9BACT|nr:SEC-C metal-binding domain-containing protein [Cesiribacter andamanensis]EMR01031.1 hypothetical protein ADICEAN_03843 [Cesiribacter andamanensis AMV16]
MGQIGRNDPCPCGSGKKYKNCHQQLEEKKGTATSSKIIMGLVIVGIVLIFIVSFMNIQTTENQAPGEAPPGKVWSPEHGHWHDAP